MPAGWVGKPGLRSDEELEIDRWGCALVWVILIAIAAVLFIWK